MSDDRLPIVKMIDDSIVSIEIEEEDEVDPYSWYGGKPETTIVQDSKVMSQTDCRTRGGIATGCRAKMWQECTFGKKPKNSDDFCYYHKFGIMCEKVTDSNGKGLN